MVRKTLTAKAVDRIKPPDFGRVEHWDGALPGFGLRVTEKGIKSWVQMVRIHGRQARLTLGSYPDLSLSEARDKARANRRAIENGGDPRAAKREGRERPSDLFEDVADLFVERYAKKANKGWKETERIFRKYVNPRWGRRRLGSISRADVVSLLDDVQDAHGLYMANRVLAQVRKLFNWALVERALIEATPIVPGMARIGEKKRDRVLDDSEITELLSVWDSLGYPFGPLFKLLLVTGQRRSEVAGMRWAHIDFEAGQWTIPGAIMKSGRPQLVPLSPLALEILGSIPADKGYVFTTHLKGERPVSGFSRAKRRCDESLAADDDAPRIERWRIHDLRRSAATNMRRLGISRETTSVVLGHAPQGVTAEHYDLYDMLPEKTDALERWGRELERLMGRERDNIVALADTR